MATSEQWRKKLNDASERVGPDIAEGIDRFLEWGDQRLGKGILESIVVFPLALATWVQDRRERSKQHAS